MLLDERNVGLCWGSGGGRYELPRVMRLLKKQLSGVRGFPLHGIRWAGQVTLASIHCSLLVVSNVARTQVIILRQASILGVKEGVRLWVLPILRCHWPHPWSLFGWLALKHEFLDTVFLLGLQGSLWWLKIHPLLQGWRRIYLILRTASCQICGRYNVDIRIINKDELRRDDAWHKLPHVELLYLHRRKVALRISSIRTRRGSALILFNCFADPSCLELSSLRFDKQLLLLNEVLCIIFGFLGRSMKSIAIRGHVVVELRSQRPPVGQLALRRTW